MFDCDSVFSFFNFSHTPPSLKQLPLKPYQIKFPLNRLVLGVDNIHLDVYINAQVHNTIKQTAALLIIKHSQTGQYFEDYSKESCENEKNTLRRLCTTILMDGINKAKSESEVQIDFLGQASMAKMCLEELKTQHAKLIGNIEDVIRTYGRSRNFDPIELFKIKEQLAEVRRNQKRILLHAGEELFQVINDVQVKGLRNIRKSNFHPEDILPDGFFLNPVLYTDKQVDDFFLIEAYVLLGQRSEDSDTYQSLKSIIYDLLSKTDLGNQSANDEELSDNKEEKQEGVSNAEGNALDPWIMEIDNIDQMFNYFDSQEQYRKKKEGKESRDTLSELSSRMKIQKRLLNLFYRRFKKLRLIKRIVAADEMKSVYSGYCPPMRPLQIREFLINPRTRKPIARQLKGRESFSLLPLHQAIRRIKSSSVREKKEYLLSFLKHFFRYHRDLNNFRILKDAMDAINLVKDEKILTLSRGNRLLHEFLLPDERVKEDKPIIKHAIIKADMRGSMDITYAMRARGLNPASYFSLNFFDPISEILFDYNASKEFIEGDAIILSIFEHEDTPQGWYSVARASGLAIRMLHVVHQGNLKSQKHDLPILEFGIGICSNQSPPTFLFDGDSRIIISPAINLADRLSGCNKILRKRFKDQRRVFNLFVFQDFPEEEMEDTADDLSLRYNVNGIELSPEAFAKLSREIILKSIMYPADNDEKVKLYTGTFPTITGKYERLVIREALILQVNPETLDVIGKTSRKYYEVCTHPDIYEFIKNNA
jgi:hypothetical protein